MGAMICLRRQLDEAAKQNNGQTMNNITLTPEAGFINFSPYSFHKTAEHFYKAKCDFRVPGDFFSPVPFFLCSRAIKLEIKSKHLEEKRQELVKNELGHNLVKAYDTLNQNFKVLNEDEYLLLKKTSNLYVSKRFEYVNVMDVGTAYNDFPNLEALDALTRKILGYND